MTTNLIFLRKISLFKAKETEATAVFVFLTKDSTTVLKKDEIVLKKIFSSMIEKTFRAEERSRFLTIIFTKKNEKNRNINKSLKNYLIMLIRIQKLKNRQKNKR